MALGGAGVLIVFGLVAAVGWDEAPRRVDGAGRIAASDIEANRPEKAVAGENRADADPEATRETKRSGLLRFKLHTQETGGSVYCGLFAEDSWPGLPIQFDVEPANGKEVVCEFEDLERGEFAAAAFHDQNGNDNLDLNWLGLPQEAWTFSRNVHRVLPLPDFEDIKFDFDGGNQMVEATLK